MICVKCEEASPYTTWTRSNGHECPMCRHMRLREKRRKRVAKVIQAKYANDPYIDDRPMPTSKEVLEFFANGQEE